MRPVRCVWMVFCSMLVVGCTEKVQLTLVNQPTEGEGEGTEPEGVEPEGVEPEGDAEGATGEGVGGEGEGEGQAEAVCFTPRTNHSYDGNVKAIIDPACSGCHNAGAPAGGYSTASYEALFKDGIITPCDGLSSFLTYCCSPNTDAIHLNKVTPANQQVLRDWITRDEAGQAVCPAPAPIHTYDTDVKAIIDPACSGCHNAAAPAGGYATTSYQALLKDGILAPCSARSEFLSYCCSPDTDAIHLNKVTPNNQLILRDWILKDGAPEKGGAQQCIEPAMPTFTYGAYVRPLMAAKCDACHNGANMQGLYRTDSYEGLLGQGIQAPANLIPCDETSLFLDYCCGNKANLAPHAVLDIQNKWDLQDWVKKDAAAKGIVPVEGEGEGAVEGEGEGAVEGEGEGAVEGEGEGAVEGEGEGAPPACPRQPVQYTYANFAKVRIDGACNGCHQAGREMGSYRTTSYLELQGNGTDQVSNLRACEETSKFLDYCCRAPYPRLHEGLFSALDQQKMIDWITKDGATP